MAGFIRVPPVADIDTRNALEDTQQELRRLRRKLRQMEDDKEEIVEAYYNIAMTEKLSFSFHLTHVSEEPVGSDKVSYFVPGVRLQASF